MKFLSVIRCRTIRLMLITLFISACNGETADSNQSTNQSSTTAFSISIEGIPAQIMGNQAITAQAKVDTNIRAEYLWQLNGETLSTESDVNLTTLQDGNYLLKLTVTDKLTSAQSVASIQFSISGRSNQKLYFSYGSYWKYSDDGLPKAEDWASVTFDDSNWKTGRGLFGYGVDAQNTFLANYSTQNFGGDKPTSYYFRKELTVDNINVVKDVYLKMIVDDAAVIYVNGAEIARTPYMVSGEIKNDSTLPTATAFPNDEFTFVIPASALNQGKNVLAVHVVNQTISSSDIAFDATLKSIDVYQGYSDGPYVFYQNEQVVVNTFTENSFKSQRYNSYNDAKVTMTLPAELGQFDVQLQSEFTPPPFRYEAPGKFFVTSDIEGNIEALVYMLINAGIMDKDFHWTYGTGHLYHIGDLFDRGDYVAESLWLLYHLETQAQAAGGNVHFLMGNHDMMNLYGDFRYVHPRYYKNAAYVGKPLIEMYGENTELGRWLRSKNIVEVAGEYLFVHAGFTSELIDRISDGSIPLDEINSIGRQHSINGYNSSDRNFYLVSRFYWDRDIARNLVTQQEVERGLNLFNAQKMMIGHTVFDKPTYLYANKVLAIDVHHHEDYQNNKFVQGVEFENGQFLHFIASKESGVTKTPIQ
ncbi:metallophosphoesterase [Vibrio cholerae]|nr:metallophosphoesterase [Vibrio cholerae]